MASNLFSFASPAPIPTRVLSLSGAVFEQSSLPPLEAVGLSGTEAINSLFEYRLVVQTAGREPGLAPWTVDPALLLDRTLTLNLELEGWGTFIAGAAGNAGLAGQGAGQRQISGVISEVCLADSHRYDAAEALTIAAATGETDAKLLQTLGMIYAGSVNPEKLLIASFDIGVGCQITFQPGADANCKANIAEYNWKQHFGSEVLTRVHPHAWLALLQAARDTKVSSLMLTSTWRPMTGQSPHRLGLGLDVKEVRDVQGREVVFNITNTKLYASKQEALDHAAWKAAEVELDKANAAVAAAESAEKRALGTANEPLAKAATQQAKTALRKAEATRNKVRVDFKTKYANGLSWTFQDALSKNSTCVTQLFDPIRMDGNTHDNEDPRANTYEELTGDERFRKRSMAFCLFRNTKAICGRGDVANLYDGPKGDLTPYALEILRSIEFLDDASSSPSK